MQTLTTEQAIVLSAFTGVLMCRMDELQNGIEKKLGYSVFTHQLPTLSDAITEAFRSDFMAILPDNVRKS